AGAVGSSTITVHAIDAAGNAIQTTFQTTVQGPNIGVATGAGQLTSGQTLSFGAHEVGDSSEMTFTVTNSGNQALDLSSVTVPAGFIQVKALATTLAIGASDTLVLDLDTTSAASRSGTLSFASNDQDTPSFNITLTG